ncbi:MAG: thymidylate synthase [Desulfurellales bacterium]|nr:MAG: thymidylate synthase [Desulfurellales bacterium]
MSWEQNYLNLLDEVITAETRDTRAGPAHSVFGKTLVIPNIKHCGFPLMTTRKIFYKPIFGELAAFLRGTEDLSTFKNFGCNYWDYNAGQWDWNRGQPLDKLEVGKIYGYQWRKWDDHNTCSHTDQLASLIQGLKNDPEGRRHVVSAWRPDQLEDMCLPPCHIMFQCYARSEGALDMIVYMRSVDLCLGLPADITLYAALLVLLAHETDRWPGNLTFMLGDTHIYCAHDNNYHVQRARPIVGSPRYKLDASATINNFRPEHLEIFGYQPQEIIKYELL